MTDDAAATYARSLLAHLGRADEVRRCPGSGAAADWAASGAMAVTGAPGGPPLLAPGAPATAARGALIALDALAGRPLGVDGHLLLGERAALTGHRRNAPWSVGGACRAVRAQDGWLAVSLARDSDLDLLPALVQGETDGEAWDVVARWARGRPAVDASAWAQLLGLPAAPVGDHVASSGPPWRVSSRPGGRGPSEPPGLVLDLSALWAGPLCGHLLQLAGARVVRVESVRRPDGSRAGSPAFDDLLHGGQPSVALDFESPDGRARLHDLVAAADVVITSARPRALHQLGLDPDGWARRTGDGVWVAITAYPPRLDGATWVGYGDDVAMAAGLVQHVDDRIPVPCGDALADPLAGCHAAVAALACWRSGGRHLVDVSLHDVARSVTGPLPVADVQPGAGGEWLVDVGGATVPVSPPTARPARAGARPLGADTEHVLRALQ